MCEVHISRAQRVRRELWPGLTASYTSQPEGLVAAIRLRPPGGV